MKIKTQQKEIARAYGTNSWNYDMLLLKYQYKTKCGRIETMANLPDINTADVGIVAFWNVHDHLAGGPDTVDIRYINSNVFR